MEAGGPPDEPLHQVCAGRGPERLRHSPLMGAEAGTAGTVGSPRKAQLRSMLLKQSLLFLLSSSHLFLYLTLLEKAKNATPPGEFTPTALNPPQLVTSALTSSQTANDICILLAVEMWAGAWGSHGQVGHLQPAGRGRSAGLGTHAGAGEAEKGEQGGGRGKE